jgi:lysylphosphatidylglycerol synthetase-like protein (DUF2156 family)
MEIPNHQHLKTTLITFIRVLIYALLVILLAKLISYDAQQSPRGQLFSEDSLTEKTQSVMLLISSVLFLITTIRYRQVWVLSVLLFCFTIASFIREQDVYLDQWLFHGSWKIGAFAAVGFALFVCIKYHKSFFESMSIFSNSFAFGVLLSGFLTTYVFSRLLGRKVFWMIVMGDRYFRDVKNAGEECVELFGYLLLLIASIEYLFYLRTKIKQPVLADKKVENSIIPGPSKAKRLTQPEVVECL